MVFRLKYASGIHGAVRILTHHSLMNIQKRPSDTLARRRNQQKHGARNPVIADEINRALQRKENLKEKQSAKFFTSIINLAAVTATGTITDFSVAPQGIVQGDRTGDRIFPLRLCLRWSLSTPDVSNVTRLILFRFKPNSVPTMAGVLDNGVGGVPGPYSQLSFQNRENIDVLWDSGLIISVSDAVSWSGNQGGTIEKDCHHRPITFNPTLTTGSDKIYLLTVSDSVAAPDPALSACMYTYYHEDAL